MPDLVLWIVPFVALALHLGLVRYNLRGVQAAWDDLMHRVLRRQVGDLEAQVALTALMADDTLVAAERARRDLYFGFEGGSDGPEVFSPREAETYEPSGEDEA